MRLSAALILTATIVAIAAPAPGQTLSERIAAIQKKREQQAVKARTKTLQVLL